MPADVHDFLATTNRYLRKHDTRFETGYVGTVQNCLNGILFLLARHPECRVVLRSALHARQEGGPLGWSNLALRWYVDGDFTTPHYPAQHPGAPDLVAPAPDFFELVAAALAGGGGGRWFLVPVTMRSKRWNYHCNFVLYDAKLHTLHRFEPYGASHRKFDGPKLDARLLLEFRRHVDPAVQMRVDTLGRQGVQSLLEAEKKRAGAALESGLCQAFSILLCDAQMTYPSASHGTITETLAQFVKAQPSVNGWARSYAAFLERIYKQFEEHRVIKAWRGKSCSKRTTAAQFAEYIKSNRDYCQIASQMI
jgi:hypothetical protein